MESRLNKLILAVWLTILLLILLTFFLAPPVFAQAGGCPASPPATGGDFEVLQSIAVAPATPENPTPQTEAQGVFYQNQITIDYQGQRVILNAHCVDDALLLRNLTTGTQWYWDYRSPDRTRIETKNPPVDISHLFSAWPGEHRLEISLIDLSPEHHSTSPIFITLSAGNLQPPPPTPPPAISKTSTTNKGIPVFGLSAQTPESLATLTPTPHYVYVKERSLAGPWVIKLATVTPTPTEIPTATLTPTTTPVVVVKYVPLPVPERSKPLVSENEVPTVTSYWTRWSVDWWWLPWGMLSGGLLGLAVMGGCILTQRRLWGIVKIEDEEGVLLGEYDLADYYGRFVIGYSDAADAVVPRGENDEYTGDTLAVIRSQKDDFGARQMVLERRDVEGLAEEDRIRPFYDGCEIQVQSVVITYSDPQPEGVDDDVLEITEEWL